MKTKKAIEDKTPDNITADIKFIKSLDRKVLEELTLRLFWKIQEAAGELLEAEDHHWNTVKKYQEFEAHYGEVVTSLRRMETADAERFALTSVVDRGSRELREAFWKFNGITAEMNGERSRARSSAREEDTEDGI